MNRFTGARTRDTPAVVAASSVLLALAGLAMIPLVAAGQVSQDAYSKAYAATDGAPTGGPATGLTAVLFLAVAFVGVLAALALVWLAVGNLAGRPWTRIVTWSLGAGTLVVACCHAAWALPGSGGDIEAGAYSDRVEATAREMTPGWVDPVATVAAFLVFPSLVAALILLALPPANAFFRRTALPEPPWPRLTA